MRQLPGRDGPVRIQIHSASYQLATDGDPATDAQIRGLDSDIAVHRSDQRATARLDDRELAQNDQFARCFSDAVHRVAFSTRATPGPGWATTTVWT